MSGSGPSPTQQMAQALLEFSALMQPVGEAVDGYRSDLERRGYSPTGAEAMAMNFHRLLIGQIISGLQK